MRISMAEATLHLAPPMKVFHCVNHDTLGRVLNADGSHSVCKHSSNCLSSQWFSRLAIHNLAYTIRNRLTTHSQPDLGN